MRRVLYGRDWREFYSIDSEDGAHDCIAADGSDGGYQLLEQPAPPLAARDSDSGRRAETAARLSKDNGMFQAPADLAETLAPSVAAIAAPLPDRFTPRAWRP